MMASRPVFGIGLGEFYQRSESSARPILIEVPGRAPQNAHNNFIQVAAGAGVAAGILFVWLIVAALVTIARRAATREPFLL